MTAYSRSLLVLGMLACGGGSEPTAPTPTPAPVVGPAAVTVLTASATYFPASTPYDIDEITIRLKNGGGSGGYYLEFWALPNSPNGPSRKAESQTVTVTQGYEETLTYRINGLGRIQAVKVRTQPVNTAAYSQTDCKVLRTEPSYCP